MEWFNFFWDKYKQMTLGNLIMFFVGMALCWSFCKIRVKNANRKTEKLEIEIKELKEKEKAITKSFDALGLSKFQGQVGIKNKSGEGLYFGFQDPTILERFEKLAENIGREIEEYKITYRGN